MGILEENWPEQVNGPIQLLAYAGHDIPELIFF